MNNPSKRYGVEDTSYQAAGGHDGIKKLVDCFYDYMDELEVAKEIRDMHPSNLKHSKERLTLFLSGWLGGPRLYQEKFGPFEFHSFINTSK